MCGVQIPYSKCFAQDVGKDIMVVRQLFGWNITWTYFRVLKWRWVTMNTSLCLLLCHVPPNLTKLLKHSDVPQGVQTWYMRILLMSFFRIVHAITLRIRAKKESDAQCWTVQNAKKFKLKENFYPITGSMSTFTHLWK